MSKPGDMPLELVDRRDELYKRELAELRTECEAYRSTLEFCVEIWNNAPDFSVVYQRAREVLSRFPKEKNK